MYRWLKITRVSNWNCNICRIISRTALHTLKCWNYESSKASSIICIWASKCSLHCTNVLRIVQEKYTHEHWTIVFPKFAACVRRCFIFVWIWHLSCLHQRGRSLIYHLIAFYCIFFFLFRIDVTRHSSFGEKWTQIEIR